ncbi:MAG: hypothetical protein ACAI35_01065 [Candidatus Methylacidiphilales bacterium]
MAVVLVVVFSIFSVLMLRAAEVGEKVFAKNAGEKLLAQPGRGGKETGTMAFQKAYSVTKKSTSYVYVEGDVSGWIYEAAVSTSKPAGQNNSGFSSTDTEAGKSTASLAGRGLYPDTIAYAGRTGGSNALADLAWMIKFNDSSR